MTKVSDFDFIGLYRAILADVARYLPTDQVGWNRNLAFLTRLASTRGQSTFTIDLPALGKKLDLSLSEGRLDLDGMNLSGSRHPNSKIPKLFWGLWMRLFDDSGCLKSNIDPNIVFFLRTLLYVGKNLEVECAPKYLYEAIKEFTDVEEALPPADPIWDGEGVDLLGYDFGHLGDFVVDPGDGYFLWKQDDPNDRALLNCVQQAADAVISSFGTLVPDKLKFKHGPGAVADLKRGDYKYDFPVWSQRLQSIFPFDQFGTTPFGLMEKLGPEGIQIEFKEPESVIIAVPKTAKGPRLIAKEPTCNQWIQQGIQEFLYSSVRHSILSRSLDFNTQDPSRESALVGSRTGLAATMDLKSASDRLSTQVVQRIFRKNLSILGPMIACRTRFLVNSIDSKMPSLFKLRKFSTQGSALTFPVQSIVFTIIALGVGKFRHPRVGLKALTGQVRVYGDDIIVPVSWEPQMRQVLHLLGLRVNDSKTFSKGNFRESCGMDAWDGHDVTPPHVIHGCQKSDPRTIASAIAVANNFFTKGLWHATAFLDSTATMANLVIVGAKSGVFGLTSFCGPKVTSKTRWNPSTQKEEVRAVGIFAKSLVVKKETAANLLQFFTERAPKLGRDLFGIGTPDTYIKYDSGVVVAGVPVIRHTWVPVELLASPPVARRAVGI